MLDVSSVTDTRTADSAALAAFRDNGIMLAGLRTRQKHSCLRKEEDCIDSEENSYDSSRNTRKCSWQHPWVQHDDMRVCVPCMMDGDGNSDRHGAIATIIVLRFDLV